MQSRLSNEARALAHAIRNVRPAVIPGTNVILSDIERTAFYNMVNGAAATLWPAHKAPDGRAASEFFDLCGIPD